MLYSSALGLHAAGLFSSVGCGLLTAGLLLRGAQALRCVGSAGVVPGLQSSARLSSCGARALLLHRVWDLPGSGIKRASPARSGGFFTTEPPGKPLSYLTYNSTA